MSRNYKQVSSVLLRCRSRTNTVTTSLEFKKAPLAQSQHILTNKVVSPLPGLPSNKTKDILSTVWKISSYLMLLFPPYTFLYLFQLSVDSCDKHLSFASLKKA